MKITKIEVQKKGNRFNLDVDDNFVCSISSTTLTHLNLYKGKELREEDIDEIMTFELENRFFDRAVNLLSSRLKTKKQIEQYLQTLALKKKGKWFNKDYNKFDQLFKKVLLRLEKIRLINDIEYSKAFVSSRIRSKPRGSRQIVNELKMKGIDNTLAKEIVSEMLPDNDEMIMLVFQKKYGSEKLDLTNKRQVDFLLRKGFDWDDITALERKLKNDI